MSLQDATGKFNELISTIGKVGLNALYPKDFELYVIAFEIVDSDDRTLEFFSMPVLPNTVTVTEPEIVNIKKTARGVVSLKSDSFVPKDISLAGSFGRNFKIVFRNKLIDFSAFRKSFQFSTPDFNGLNVKTGYGITKVFQSLLNNSKLLDLKGNPVRLYFYNFAFGENYIVEVVDKSFTQAKDSSNMIWNYNVSLKAVAPIDSSLIKKSSLLRVTSASVLQNGITSLTNDIVRYKSANKIPKPIII
jgi:hypothetical protein